MGVGGSFTRLPIITAPGIGPGTGCAGCAGYAGGAEDAGEAGGAGGTGAAGGAGGVRGTGFFTVTGSGLLVFSATGARSQMAVIATEFKPYSCATKSSIALISKGAADTVRDRDSFMDVLELSTVAVMTRAPLKSEVSFS